MSANTIWTKSPTVATSATNECSHNLLSIVPFFRIFHNETLKRFPIFSSNHFTPPHSPSPIFIFLPGVSSLHTLPESFRKTSPKISTVTCSQFSSFFTYPILGCLHFPGISSPRLVTLLKNLSLQWW